MNNGPEWFAPKMYGYGAGLPIAWQGWAVLAAFIILIVASAALLAERSPLAMFVVTVFLVTGLIVITAKTTKGGFKWRWGETDIKGRKRKGK